MARNGKHIHQYSRVDIGKKKEFLVYKCKLPNCPHYLPPELVVGKVSVCPFCDLPFVVQQSDLRLVTPHCETCIDEVAQANSLKARRNQDKVSVPGDLGQSILDLVSKGKLE